MSRLPTPEREADGSWILGGGAPRKITFDADGDLRITKTLDERSMFIDRRQLEDLVCIIMNELEESK